VEVWSAKEEEITDQMAVEREFAEGEPGGILEMVRAG
jgi:hypothetical protein